MECDEEYSEERGIPPHGRSVMDVVLYDSEHVYVPPPCCPLPITFTGQHKSVMW